MKRPDLDAIEARANECPCCKSGRPHSSHYSSPPRDIVDLLAYVRQLETLLAKTEEIQNLHRLIESGQATMIEESRDFFAALKLPKDQP